MHVVVRYAPTVARMEKATVRGGSGVGLEIACVTAANPEPKVTWYKDEQAL